MMLSETDAGFELADHPPHDKPDESADRSGKQQESNNDGPVFPPRMAPTAAYDSVMPRRGRELLKGGPVFPIMPVRYPRKDLPKHQAASQEG